jgi:hypothetical protein
MLCANHLQKLQTDKAIHHHPSFITQIKTTVSAAGMNSTGCSPGQMILANPKNQAAYASLGVYQY